MNKFLTQFLLASLLFLIQCKDFRDKINISQKRANQKIIIRSASDDKNSIITIQFPNKIVLLNNSIKEYDLLTINYKYNNIPSNRISNLGLYKSNNDKLEKVRNNEKKVIPSNKSLSLVFFSRHFVDSSKITQQHFRPYIEKMLKENKDTLHIGTVQKFKEMHKELFNKLTEKDSISVQFLDGKKLGECVTLPVEW